MKLTTGYKKPIASSGDDALELSSNNSYLLLAGGGHKALSELVSPADLTTELSNYVTIGSNQTITGVKTFSLTIAANISGNADTVDGLHSSAFKKTWIAYAGKNYTGWITIAKWTISTPNHFSTYPFMLSIYRQHVSPSTETYTFSITFGWDTANIVQVNGNAGDRIIEKLRVAKCSDNLTYRLEMYVNTTFTTYRNACYCVAYGNYGSDFDFNTVCELSSDVSSTLAEITTAKNYIVGNLSGNAATASSVDWSGVTNKPDSFTPSSHMHTTSEITDFPTSLPANGGNADYATSADNADTSNRTKFLETFKLNSTTDTYGSEYPIWAQWSDYTNVRLKCTNYTVWIDKADYATSAGNASTADSIEWSGVTNKPVIGNGALHIKVNGTELTPEGGIFTANKGGDSTIDLEKSLATRPEINTLGGRMDKIDTSIAELNAKMQSTISSDYSSEGGDEGKGVDEGNAEESEYTPLSKQVGTISLKFRNFSSEVFVLPVYDVWVHYITDVVGPFGYVNYCYEISLVVGPYTGTSLEEITLGTYNFFIRGANMNNKLCEFDIRGNGTINSAVVTFIGDYMHLKCYLLLHGEIDGEDYNIGDAIMSAVKNEQFDAYLCLRQTP